MAEITKIGVIGAGLMGMGIAAHCANAGFSVVLLDMPEAGKNRSARAQSAIKTALKTEPAPFMHPRFARRILAGNLEDDLALLADCDWVIEVVIEDLAIKQALYAKLDAVLSADAIVTSNTSTIPLAALSEGMSDARRARFAITHFFNPPRYQTLLELVSGPATLPEVRDQLRDLCDQRLGKTVVLCRDAPGFIGNRIGVYWTLTAVNAAMDLGLTVEEADALMGPAFGIPKTGVFGLVDLVGWDLMPLIGASLSANLPAQDAFHSAYRDDPRFTEMVNKGYTGRKGKGGFYRLNREGKEKRKQALDLETFTYRDLKKPSLTSVQRQRKGLKAVLASDDRGSAFLWRVWTQTLSYALNVAEELAYSLADIDAAMRAGYRWRWGPFELLDALGPAAFAEQLKAEGQALPKLLEQVGEGYFYRTEAGQREVLDFDGSYQPLKLAPGVETLAAIKLNSEPLLKNGSAALWDGGSGVAIFEFRGRANALDEPTMDLILASVKHIAASDSLKALVIYNEGAQFSPGANLGLAIFAINLALWAPVESMVKKGQEAYMALKYAPFPVVAAPFGYAFGGGCEILLHADAVQAHAETYSGLVEVGVGLVPGWGGCKEMVLRHYELARWPQRWDQITDPSYANTGPKGPIAALLKPFEMITTAKVSKSAYEAQDMQILNAQSGITMNRDRLLADAKARALALVEGYQPPDPEQASAQLPGKTAQAAFANAVHEYQQRGLASAYDAELSLKVGHILSGGDEADVTETTSEQRLLDLEYEAFVALLRQPKTQARVQHMMETKKPLRN